MVVFDTKGFVLRSIRVFVEDVQGYSADEETGASEEKDSGEWRKLYKEQLHYLLSK